MYATERTPERVVRGGQAPEGGNADRVPEGGNADRARSPLVTLSDVSVSYDGCKALQNVNLEIYSDDFLGVIGPNGGGKTTLVKAILGALPYSGRITFSPELFGYRRRGGHTDNEGGLPPHETTPDGQGANKELGNDGSRKLPHKTTPGGQGANKELGNGESRKLPHKATPGERGRTERLIGYMPQVSHFDRAFPIAVQEVVLSGLQGRRGFFGGYTKSDRAKARDLLSMAGIAETARYPIGEISGGQLQRALLCRAVISDPKLLILDEPANFVDNRFENELYRILAELNRRMAIVMVSHDVGTISSVVKEIVCVNGHVHRHRSNIITEEQLRNYDCPIQIVSHGHVPHTVLAHHAGDGCCAQEHTHAEEECCAQEHTHAENGCCAQEHRHE